VVIILPTPAGEAAIRWTRLPCRSFDKPDPAGGAGVAFHNQRGTAEQWIKEAKDAIKWTRLNVGSEVVLREPKTCTRTRHQFPLCYRDRRSAIVCCICREAWSPTLGWKFLRRRGLI
jgi:hypothetical protein